MDTLFPESAVLIDLEAELEFCTRTSCVYQLLCRHDASESSLKGWVAILYPCVGEHTLCISAVLDPGLTQFESATRFGGAPNDKTNALIQQLLQDVQELVGAPSDCTWYIGLQDRSISTFDCRPPRLI